MTDPNGDHRERPVGGVLTVLATSALAVVAVLALVGVLVLVFGQRSGSGSGSSGQATETPADSGLSARASTPTASSSAAGENAEATNAPAAVPVPADSKVVVLNATARKGLAARYQQTLEARGWDVVAVGNFRGNVPATTIYYPSGQQRAAEALDEQFTWVNRVRPAFSGISQTRLTLILAGDLSP